MGNVHDAENLLVTNTDAFVASLERRARAVAAQQLAAEQYKKSLEYEIKAQELENKAADVRKNEEIDMTAYAADTRFGARSASELAEERANRSRTKQHSSVSSRPKLTIMCRRCCRYSDPKRRPETRYSKMPESCLLTQYRERPLAPAR